MAIFNLELTGSVLVIFVVTRISAVFNLPHLLLNGVHLFVPPSKADFDKIQPPKHKRRKSDKSSSAKGSQKSVDEMMEVLDVKTVPATQGLFVDELFWGSYDTLVLCFICALLTSMWSSAFRCFSTENQKGSEWPSILLFSVAALAIKANLDIVGLTTWSVMEARFGYFAGFVCFFLSCALLFTPALTQVVDTDLEADLEELHERLGVASGFLFREAPFSIEREDFKILSKLALALACGCITCGLVIPCLRFTNSVYKRLAAPAQEGGFLLRLVLCVDFVLPLALALSWTRPALADPISNPNGCRPEELWKTVAGGGCDPGGVLTFDQFHTLRVVVLAGWCLLRGLVLLRPLLHSFLQSGLKALRQGLAEGREKAAEGEGFDKNNLSAKVTVRLQYLVMAATQYLAPTILLGCLAIVLASKGGTKLQWCRKARTAIGGSGVLGGQLDYLAHWPSMAAHQRYWVGYVPSTNSTVGEVYDLIRKDSFKSKKVQEFFNDVVGLTIFTPSFYLSLGGFLVWWTCAAIFVVSLVCMVFWGLTPSSENDVPTSKKRVDKTTKKKRS
mmetsp:Transcript_4178/g.6236  ORF Transcript_4178/g.6236 Transcript_4178/m.6236 type:complete len:560 (-) Transcript_4178:10-1689(-)|eukprot:CAMPEP_0113937920 /NCGR_PEP_ID=MMETSP1339-20121228/4401_1 /TAXON_ID=94617 /ORGANISM="Fibrocapsa japonica" /LENGTH=559 /DNA_ID=CAMNT_0000940833 /DNA_START=25 /DNA_END=1704 /DNA_ORIENTATION=- /assembly_acc=CAM_ASM_000762